MNKPFLHSTQNALMLKALQMTGSLNTVCTLHAAAQPEQYVKNSKQEKQVAFVLITSPTNILNVLESTRCLFGFSTLRNVSQRIPEGKFLLIRLMLALHQTTFQTISLLQTNLHFHSKILKALLELWCITIILIACCKVVQAVLIHLASLHSHKSHHLVRFL